MCIGCYMESGNTCPKDADGMVNSADPEQSDLGLHCPDLSVRKL